MAAFDRPSAAAQTMVARSPSRWPLVGRFAQSVNLARASSVSVIAVG
jgi:hypothetical protein